MVHERMTLGVRVDQDQTLFGACVIDWFVNPLTKRPSACRRLQRVRADSGVGINRLGGM
jgi:hypothetical protein